MNNAFAVTLVGIELADMAQDYKSRNKLIYAALGMAEHYNIPCGIRNDPLEPEWPVVYFELSTGQVSWHVPQHVKEWDGHTKEEKYERVHKWVRP